MSAAPMDRLAEEWPGFCAQVRDRLRSAGAHVLGATEDEVDQADGLRVVLRDFRLSVERRIEEYDPEFPAFLEPIRETYHLIADTADYAIADAYVSGARTYRVWGNIGIADAVNFTTSGPTDDSPVRAMDSSLKAPDEQGKTSERSVAVTGKLEKADLDLDEDGNFALTMSAERPRSGVWLPMALNTNRLIVRNIFFGNFRDHRRYRAAKLHIECLDRSSEHPAAYSAEDLSAGLERIASETGATLRGRAALFDRIRSVTAKPGQFNDDQTFWRTIGANPRTWWQQTSWSLEPDEALVIHQPAPPGCSYWVLSATNRWMETLDFRFAQAYMNKYITESDPSGGVNIVLAGRDPGVPNWIHAAGHRTGCLVWRWNDLTSRPELPSATVMPIDAVPTS